MYMFDGHVAKLVGITGAVIFQNLYWWVEKNKANGANYHDGKYWTYNSVSAFEKLFPFMTTWQIRKALEKLEEEKFIISGTFNKAGYDRTKWYALGEKGRKYSFVNFTNPFESITNPFDENHEPIPVINTVKNTDMYPSSTDDGGASAVAEKASVYEQRFDEFWKYYPKKIGKGAARKAFVKRKPSQSLTKKMIDAVEKQKKSAQWQKEKGQFIPNPSTWINQERWEDEVEIKTTSQKPSRPASGINGMSTQEYMRQKEERRQQALRAIEQAEAGNGGVEIKW